MQPQDPVLEMRPIENPPPILAAVIGINKYASDSPDFENLNGAVGDADAFENFLTKRMQVPKENIYSIRDEQASREGIINSFIFLRDNPQYEKDCAAIIIYYAGHGAQGPIPAEWEDWHTPTGRIEMLCPSDIGCLTTVEINEEKKKDVIPGLPDRTISALLNQISDRRGNNITLILDCCSSAGMNRSKDADGHVPRRICNPPPIKGYTDQQFWPPEARCNRPVEEFSGRFRASHVLLAACGREQLAWEDGKSKRGLFTDRLLAVLASDEFNTLTYTSLMNKLSMPRKQTPHCEGAGVNRRLFNSQDSGADSSFIFTTRVREGPITLEAGTAQGITVGSRFAVHRTNLIDTSLLPNPCLGYLVATSVNILSSTLELPPHAKRYRMPWHFYCKVIEHASQSISIFSRDRQWIETVFPPGEREQLSVVVVDDVAKCHLELTVKGDSVLFDRHEDMVMPYIGSRIHYAVNANDIDAIRKVVRASLHFYHHLTRIAPDDFGDVRMEMRELKQEVSASFDVNLKAVGRNLIAQEPATVVANDDRCLGMTIFNESEAMLYPYLFYFDPTDLTITEWYTPPFGAGSARHTANLTIGVDAPLPPKSQLAIGYGEGGSLPWQFVLREGENKDVGFFRLFLSTRPANFQSIIQISPFEEWRDLGGNLPPAEVVEPERWAVKTATVIQVGK
ncbi:hypothetical protein BDZ97DRAFT_2004443, partial [Flammula alnicola]